MVVLKTPIQLAIVVYFYKKPSEKKMRDDLTSYSHTLGESNLHLQFTPAYRCSIFARSLVRELTIAYLVERPQQLGVFVSAIDCWSDHIHLFIERWKNQSIVRLVREMKSYSSRKMRQGHMHMFEDLLWGDKFWSSGYFHRTVGVVTKETVKKYVAESQKKHWTQQNANHRNQKTLLAFAS